ncbi:MAG: hypothetical protein ABJ004_07495 [Cyclobacteriaceae bacterium]
MIEIGIIVALLWLAISCYNFLSGRKLIRDLIHYYLLKTRTLNEWDQYCTANPNKTEIIISLSTIPNRIGLIVPTLKSLLSQNHRPKAIHLYVPKFSEREQKKYVIPEELTALDNFKIIRTEKDWGPATKFIPAIQTLVPNQKILVVDDDNLYPKSYLQSFSFASKKEPNKVLAATGWRVPEDLTDRSTTLWSNIRQLAPTPILATRINRTYPTDIVQGYSGYLIQPVFFETSELINYSNTPESAKYVDDVWVSAHAKVPKVIFPMSRISYSVFWKQKFYKSTSLAKINNWNRERNEDRNNSIMIKFFKERWLFNSKR